MTCGLRFALLRVLLSLQEHGGASGVALPHDDLRLDHGGCLPAGHTDVVTHRDLQLRGMACGREECL